VADRTVSAANLSSRRAFLCRIRQLEADWLVPIFQKKFENNSADRPKLTKFAPLTHRTLLIAQTTHFVIGSQKVRNSYQDNSEDKVADHVQYAAALGSLGIWSTTSLSLSTQNNYFHSFFFLEISEKNELILKTDEIQGRRRLGI
jgi:hypothetical protein